MFAYLSAAKTYLGVKPAPIMAGFSARGPSLVQPLILKVYKIYLHFVKPTWQDA